MGGSLQVELSLPLLAVANRRRRRNLGFGLRSVLASEESTFHPSVGLQPASASALSVSLPDEMRLLVTPEMNHLSFSAETKWMTIERGLLLSSPQPPPFQRRLLVPAAAPVAHYAKCRRSPKSFGLMRADRAEFKRYSFPARNNSRKNSRPIPRWHA